MTSEKHLNINESEFDDPHEPMVIVNRNDTPLTALKSNKKRFSANAQSVETFSRRRMNINVLLLSLAFMFSTSATWTSSIIVESVIQQLKPPHGSFVGNEGYFSLSIIYLVQIGSPIYSITALKFLGMRRALLLGGAQSLIYCSVFLLYPVPWLVYLTSITFGIGQGIIWTLQGVVIADNSNSSYEATRNMGIFWAIFSCCGLGDLYSAYVFNQLEGEHIDENARQSIYLFLCLLAAISLLLFAFITPEVNRGELLSKTDESSAKWQSYWREVVIELLRTLRERKTLLLLIGPTVYAAMQLGFYGGPFPAAIGFTQQFGSGRAKVLMSATALMLGAGDITAGLFVSTMNRFVSRIAFMFVALAAHCVGYAFTYVTLPAEAPLAPTNSKPLLGPFPAIILAAGFFLGMGDGLVQTQLYAAMTDVIDSDEILMLASGTDLNDSAEQPKQSRKSGNRNVAPAFAMNNALQCAVCSAVSAYSAVLYLPWHFVIILPIAVWGVMCFVVVERSKVRRRQKAALEL